MGRGVILALIWSVVLGLDSPSTAEEFVPVRQAAFGETEQSAVRKAYYAAADRVLMTAAGREAAGPLGVAFRKDFERDSAGFRLTYFTSDTTDRCAPQDNGYLCEVVGDVMFSAVQQYVRTWI